MLAIALALALTPPAAPTQTQIRAHFGESAGDWFGSGLLALGDLDGDGADDYAVRAQTGPFDRGTIYVYSGFTGVELFRVVAGSDEGSLGSGRTAIGDLNGDGFRDLVLWSFLSAGAGTRVRAVSGVDGSTIWSVEAAAQSAPLGRALSSISDVDGDGVDEVLLGAGLADSPTHDAAGSVQLRSGATGAILYTRYESIAGAELGHRVLGLGDLDGDGFDDFAATVRQDIVPSGNRRGMVGLYSGLTGGLILKIRSFTLFEAAWFGEALASAGDVDQDGVEDIVIGAPQSNVAGMRSGYAAVHSGANGARLQMLFGTAPEQLFGYHMGGSGDVDGDGFADWVISGPAYGVGTNMAKRIAVISGGTMSEIMTFGAGAPQSMFLADVAMVGDANFDGFADVLLGAHQEGQAGVNAGAVYLVRSTPANGEPICLALENSSGTRAEMSALSPSGFQAAANDLTFQVAGLPTQSAGYFLVSQGSNIVQNPGGSFGRLCISGGQIGRYAGHVLWSGGSGTAAFSPDLTNLPLGGAGGSGQTSASPGDTFNFQMWFRDVDPSTSSFANYSDAIAITLQ